MTNCVKQTPQGTYYEREAQAVAAGIVPGHLITRIASGKVQVHATADGIPDIIRIADISTGDAGGPDRVYAADELVNYLEMSTGKYVGILVGASQTIALEGELASAGDGTFKSPAVAGTGVLFKADEAVTTGVGETALIRAILVNNAS